MDKVNYFNISEDEVLNNVRIKAYVVENKIDIYNEMARVMSDRLKKNNEKGTVTLFDKFRLESEVIVYKENKNV